MSSQTFVLDAGQLGTGEPLYIRGDVRYASEPVEARPVLIFVHGFKGFKDWGFFPYMAERFAEQGFYAVTFNFSCNGVRVEDFDELDRFAHNTYSREQQDLALVLQAINDRSLPAAERADAGRVYLLGHSRGGGNSIIFAAEHPQIAGVVTWNGIARADLFDEAFRAQVAERGVAYVPNARTKQNMPISAAFYEDLEQNRERYDIVRRLTELRIPVLQVQGDQDAPRLKASFRQLSAAAPQHETVTIEGGTHTFGAAHPFDATTLQLEQAVNCTLKFLSRHM
ncbi:alpha/beta hydrolase [Paenibacillus xerothermodurans]|uniref:Alpha/beta hydrolase n=1 Tax=Paenibacillus xerothermodurans TaxID=1977292 RepID=A0A2W1P5I2_PAEXE|nr:alpha/beta hydrolase [Paenibacillus xerothermodurans]